MRIGLGKAVLAALSALGIMLGAGGATATPLQVTGEGLVFASFPSSVSLGGVDLSGVEFGFTGLIDSAADSDPADDQGLFTLGATTFTLASGESFTALPGELQLFLEGFGSDFVFRFIDPDDLFGGGVAIFSIFLPLFDVDAPTPGALSNLWFASPSGGGGTVDLGPDGVLTYVGGLFSFGPDATITFAAPAVAVPEPATLALFGLGLAGLGFAMRRRRRGSRGEMLGRLPKTALAAACAFAVVGLAENAQAVPITYNVDDTDALDFGGSVGAGMLTLDLPDDAFGLFDATNVMGGPGSFITNWDSAFLFVDSTTITLGIRQTTATGFASSQRIATSFDYDLPGGFVSAAQAWALVVADPRGRLEGVTITEKTTSLPEPATFALFGLGLAGLGFAMRRRQL